jgi:hypothetical protein
MVRELVLEYTGFSLVLHCFMMEQFIIQYRHKQYSVFQATGSRVFAIVV